jgi:hypothetical protein
MICNAGVKGDWGPLAQQPREQLDLVIDINLKGVVLSMKHALAHMIPARSGVIINLASVQSFRVGFPGAAFYTASKAAVVALTRAAALENGQFGIRAVGTLVATVPGSATSATVTLPTATTDICVRGVVGPVSSTDSCTTGSCPVFVPPPAPNSLACSILTTDPVSGCTVEASWANQGSYSVINVYLDGVLQSTETGTTTSWQSSLGLSPDAQQICIEALDDCGGVLSQVCCDVICDAGPIFVRGDCNADGANNIADVVAALGFLFAGAGIPLCGDACDINDDGGFDISDAVFLLSNLFSDGNFPPAPYPNCGVDATDTDSIDCDSFPPCP